MKRAAPSLVRKMRHRRVREKVVGTMARPRLCVFRSLKHTYAQVIDDVRGRTLVSASTLDADVRGKTEGTANVKSAELLGSLLAQRALDRGIKCVVFDRAGYQYHGRVRALAEAARQAGLQF